MVSEEIYELCVPVLQDKELNDEDQVEKVEEIVKENTSLSGSLRDDAVLNILWRHRGSTKPGVTPPSRHKVIRRTSPAPWQLSRMPSTSTQSPSSTSPAPPPGLPLSRPSFPKSSTVSPFTSPRPSPQLALAQQIPHSPSLNTYQFSEPSTAQTSDNYGDLGRDNVDWLVSDDTPLTHQKAPSVASSVTSLSAAAPEFQPPPRMNPYDTLRSVLGDRKTDEEINASLEANGYDLAATMAALTETEGSQMMAGSDNNGRILVGKSMSVDQSRPDTPSNARSSIVCKYYSTSGQCLRADCRFSHDLTTHICKYWVKGACLAGDGCAYSHDPSAVMGILNGNNGNNLNKPGSPASNNSPRRRPLRNSHDSFAASQSPGSEQWPSPSQTKHSSHVGMQGGSPYRMSSPSNGSNMRNKHVGMNQPAHRFSQTNQRPASRHQNRDIKLSSLSVDDPDDFPTLSSINTKASSRKSQSKKPQNKSASLQKENNSGLSNAIKLSSSPTPSPRRLASKLNNTANDAPRTGPEKADASNDISPPKDVPWFDKRPCTEEYRNHVKDGLLHCNERTAFYQSANFTRPNDPEKARQMELDGEWHWERGHRCYNIARRHLYDLRRNYFESAQSLEDNAEVYVDLHGLQPDEALEYIEPILWRQECLGRRAIYIITGTSHSKNCKDKIAHAVKSWLNSWQYVFREFSMDGDSPCYSAVNVLGVDPASYEKDSKGNAHGPAAMTAPETSAPATGASKNAGPTVNIPSGKVQLLKRDADKKDQDNP